MKVFDRGHIFGLNVLDNLPGHPTNQIIRFVKRVGEKYPGNEGGPYPGTTSQEVTRVLISRAIYLDGQIHCWETWLSIYLYGFIVWLYEHRAAKRHHRKAPSFHDATFGKTCETCGHVGCTEHGRDYFV
jgi:hypothetical protein